MREVVLDRFFIDKDKLWIIDFKTSPNKELVSKNISNNLTATANTFLNFIRFIQFTVVFTI